MNPKSLNPKSFSIQKPKLPEPKSLNLDSEDPDSPLEGLKLSLGDLLRRWSPCNLED